MPKLVAGIGVYYHAIKNSAERTRLAPRTLGRLLRQMEKCGPVLRRRCRDDGRAVRIHLTPLGRSLQGRCEQAVKSLKSIVERGLSRDEVKAVKAGLSRMITNMQSPGELT